MRNNRALVEYDDSITNTPRLCRKIMSNMRNLTSEDVEVLQFLAMKGSFEDKSVKLIKNK